MSKVLMVVWVVAMMIVGMAKAGEMEIQKEQPAMLQGQSHMMKNEKGEMVDISKMHCLGIKGEEASFCACGADCKCKMDTLDMTKCSCGKPIEKVNIKGMYYCTKCDSGVTDKPGNCSVCGTELKQVE